MSENDIESTNRLLRVIIALLLRKNEKAASSSLRQQIEFLEELGIGASEIAKIIGRSTTYVSKELAGIRKAARKEGKK